MGYNPSHFKGDNMPVETISWNDCQEFINKLNNITHKNFRLPTESEWEFAARGGNKSRHTRFSGSNILEDVAWFANNSNDILQNVALKFPNELGIYDMSGNVWEWCNDCYQEYPKASQEKVNLSQTAFRCICRGGGYKNYPELCRISFRNTYANDAKINTIGFRLCLSE